MLTLDDDTLSALGWGDQHTAMLVSGKQLDGYGYVRKSEVRMTCVKCGKNIVQTRGEQRVFCTERCRVAVVAKKTERRPCVTCGVVMVLEGKGLTRQACSKACAHRRRMAMRKANNELRE